MSPYRPAARRRVELARQHKFDHHPSCACGCGELADECAGPRPNPLGSLRISDPPQPNPYPRRDITALPTSEDNDTAGGTA